jgi:hypothetical protein
VPTALLAAVSLIAGYAVVAATGSRPLGGIVLLAIGLCCAWLWLSRHGRRVALELTAALFGAFVLSHLLALLIGPWPSVLTCAALVAATALVRSGAHANRFETPR